MRGLISQGPLIYSLGITYALYVRDMFEELYPALTSSVCPVLLGNALICFVFLNNTLLREGTCLYQ